MPGVSASLPERKITASGFVNGQLTVTIDGVTTPVESVEVHLTRPDGTQYVEKWRQPHWPARGHVSSGGGTVEPTAPAEDQS